VSLVPGFELRFNKRSNIDGTGKCNINRTDAFTYLAVFEIETEEKPILDRIEGLGKGYVETLIETQEFGHCVTYEADPTVIDESLMPTDWYKEMVLLGCRFHSFPEEYVQAVEKLPSVEDPDASRSRANWKIVEKLRNDT